jgi:hypothetical protein
MGELCRTHRVDECYKIFVRKHEGKRLLGRPMRRWEVNIIMDLREIEGRVWTGLIRSKIGANGGLL